MSKVLIIGEYDNGHLNSATGRAVTFARQLNAEAVEMVFLGASNLEEAAAKGAKLEGVTKVLTVSNPANENPLAAVAAPQIVALAADYTHILAGNSSFGKDVLPRVAAMLNSPHVTDAMEVLGERSFKRPTYAGNAIVTVEVPEGCKVCVTVRGASFAAAAETANAAPIEAKTVDAELPSYIRFLSRETTKSDRPDLQTAKRVVSGGRGVGSGDNFKVVFDFADKIGAAVGASRAAVDAGYVPNDMQVGQTGKIIAPELYFAVGISGAIQHLAGIKDAGTIVAINKDEEAPIFEVADLGLVGDLFQVLPELTQEVAKG
jgi:electron transfer flavoprotein alpha subunit